MANEIKRVRVSGTDYNIVDQGARDLIAALPSPMVFKGTLGTSGTITSLPAASKSNEGWTYKVITDGTYSGQKAKVGDLFISDGSKWVYVPSADEPSGTVTNVASGDGLTGGPITTSGTLSVDYTKVQKKLTAGSNISISDNNVISATVDNVYVSKNTNITGNGSTKSFSISNDFNTADVMVSIRDNNTGKDIIADVTKTNSTITIEFAAAPASGTVYRVNIFSGVASATLNDGNEVAY